MLREFKSGWYATRKDTPFLLLLFLLVSTILNLTFLLSESIRFQDILSVPTMISFSLYFAQVHSLRIRQST